MRHGKKQCQQHTSSFFQAPSSLLDQTNLRSNYFKAIEHGTKLWNAHRALNGGAFVLGLIGMIIILSAEEFKEGLGSKERHVIYGFVIIVAMFLQILFRVAYPDVSFIGGKGGGMEGARDG